MSCAPLCHVLCHMTLCPAAWGARVAWVYSPGAIAQSQPRAFHSGQQRHLPQPTTATSGPLPGLPTFQGLHALAPLIPPWTLTDLQALPPLAQGGTQHSQDHLPKTE